ncbi:MAG: DUF2007 domain-containing protein [Anaerolineaceae bacterium]
MNNDNLDDLVLIYLAKGRFAGEMVKSFLEAQGISVMLSQEAAGGVYGLTVGDLGAAEIFVHAKDEEKAKDLLQAMEDGEFSDEHLVEKLGQKESLGPQSRSEEQDLQDRKRVLILCTGNSARSQMAEAVVNHDCWDKWVAFSAGTKPAGFVHPYAQAVLKEAGIFHQGESKSVDVFKGQTFDLIITVCDNARETCPIWLGKGNRIHVGFEDPAAVTGSEMEKMAAFRKTLVLIRATIPPILNQYASE